MTQRILKVFEAAYFASFAERTLSFVAIYRRRRKGAWVYSVAHAGAHEKLLDEFSGLEAYRSVQNKGKWVSSTNSFWRTSRISIGGTRSGVGFGIGG